MAAAKSARGDGAFEKAEAQLEDLLESFETGDIEAAVEKTLLSPAEGDERPIDSWSFSNKLLCFVAGTEDARGYQQWQEVDRHVEEGATAIRILVPQIVTEEVEVETDDGGTETEEEEKLVGYSAAPVFRFEDTEGEPLPDVDYEPPEMPELVDVAEGMGYEVEWDASRSKQAFGSFSPSDEAITLHTHADTTFYHELAHAVHHEITAGIDAGQDPHQEAVAELSGAVLASLYGEANEGYTYEYLARYAEETDEDVYGLCLSVISDVEAVLRYVLAVAEE